MNNLFPLFEMACDIEQDIITEEKSGIKNIYLKGIYSQGDIKNNNNRSYPTSVLEREIKKLQPKISSGIGYGEFGHPKTIEEIKEINPSNVSHRIVEIKKNKNEFLGKSVLIPEGLGKMAIQMVETGGKLAISSRGLGSVNRKTGIVESNYRMITYDLCFDPGMPKAQQTAIMESKDFFLGERYFTEEEWKVIEKNRSRILETAFFRTDLLSGLLKIRDSI